MSALARPYAISQPAICVVLEEAGLLVNERRGKPRLCRLEVAALASATEWLDFYRRFWSDSFERLDHHLKQTERKSDVSDR